MNRHMPWPSCQRILIRSPRRPRKTNRWPAVRIALEHLLHLQRQAVHAPAHVGVAGRQPDPRPTGNGIIARPGPAAPPRPPPDRQRPRSAPGRRPPARSRSAPEGRHRVGNGRRRRGRDLDRGEAWHPRRRHCALDPGPDPNSLRQAKSWLGLTPCRRATPCTVAPGPKVSATSRRLSSSDQRRRACPRKISTIRRPLQRLG